MDAPAFENLDLACAKVGKTIAERPSKDLRTSLRVRLRFWKSRALCLFPLSESAGGSDAPKVNDNIYKFLKTTPQQAPLLSGDAESSSRFRRWPRTSTNYCWPVIWSGKCSSMPAITRECHKRVR
jgi:hypothetical protein